MLLNMRVKERYFHRNEYRIHQCSYLGKKKNIPPVKGKKKKKLSIGNASSEMVSMWVKKMTFPLNS